MIKLRPMRVSDSECDIVQKCWNCLLYYHKGNMITDEGQIYCPECHDWKLRKKRLHEARIRIEDDPEQGR